MGKLGQSSGHSKGGRKEGKKRLIRLMSCQLLSENESYFAREGGSSAALKKCPSYVKHRVSELKPFERWLSDRWE